MRRVSLNMRAAHDAPTTSEIEVALFAIEHPDLAETLRLSTDPGERISTEPLMYGTRSSWDGANRLTDPYLFILAAAELPSDLEDAPAAATIVLDNVDSDIAGLLRSFTNPATIHMAIVLASSPDEIEVEFRDLKIVSVSGDAAEISLSISRRPIEDETVPMDRFTIDRFPGLFR